MKSAYRVLAYLIAVEVVVQAMAAVYAIAGLGKWVQDGGVMDRSVMESDATPFPEVVGFAVHGINGTMIIPVIALALLVMSFFARVPGAVRWAAAVVLLVALQLTLGLLGHAVPALGAVHGLNALLLFTAALHTARRTRESTAAAAVPAGSPLATQA